MGKMIKKRVSIILILAMMLSLITPHTISLAKSKPKLSSKKANIVVGKTKKIRVKCRVAGKISVQSLNPSFCGVVKLSGGI